VDAHLNFAVFGFDDGQQFDPVAELVGVTEVFQREIADAFDMDRVHPEPAAVGQRGEDRGLVRGVEAVDVERRIRFGITELLRVGEHGVERGALILHPGEDVVAGAVHDSVNPVDPVRDQSFAERFDDRNAARHARFVADVDAGLFRRVENLLAVQGEEGFVGGHDMFPGGDGVEDELAGERGAADKFDDDVRSGDRFGGVGSQKFPRYRDTPVGSSVEIGDTGQNEFDAGAFGDDFAVLEDVLRDSGTDRAESDNTDFDFFHVLFP